MVPYCCRIALTLWALLLERNLILGFEMVEESGLLKDFRRSMILLNWSLTKKTAAVCTNSKLNKDLGFRPVYKV